MATVGQYRIHGDLDQLMAADQMMFDLFTFRDAQL